jgi:hypothetical protein
MAETGPETGGGGEGRGMDAPPSPPSTSVVQALGRTAVTAAREQEVIRGLGRAAVQRK